MKALASGLGYRVVRSLVLLSIMLSFVTLLLADMDLIGKCPVKIDYKVKHVNLLFGKGAKYAYTYTISMDSSQVTYADKQKTYSLASEFFKPGERDCGYSAVSSDIRNGQIFTYSQFPITGHLVVKYTGNSNYPKQIYLPYPGAFEVIVSGSLGKETDPKRLWIGNYYKYQLAQSELYLGLPDPAKHTRLIRAFRLVYKLPWFLGLGLFILIIYLAFKWDKLP